jgi:hypothetical protein
MTSLTDVYEGNVGRVASRRQQLLGTGLFLAGGAMVVGAIGLATTNAGVQSLGRYPARELAGVLAGFGLPAVLLGVFAVLPASRSVRAAALTGSSIAMVGVVLFQYAYPYDWVSSAPLLTLATTAVYFLGVLTVFWCLFVALATFKTRNDPGGTAKMEITREGTIRLVEEARSLGRFGGVGLFGTDLDGEVETQTNRSTTTTHHDGATVESETTGTAVGDGGGAATSMTAPGAGSDGAEEPATTAASPASPSPGHGTNDRGTSASGSSSPTSQPTSPSSTGRVRSNSTRSGSSGSGDVGPSASGGERLDGAGPVDGGAVFSNDFLRSTQGDDDLDQYCGNCRHFEYVMEDGEPTPYCGFHDRTMDDLEACSNWLKR